MSNMFGRGHMKVCDIFKRNHKGLHLAPKSDGLLEQLAIAYSFYKLLLFITKQMRSDALFLLKILNLLFTFGKPN